MATLYRDLKTFRITDESLFNRMLLLERKKAERSGASFLLVLLTVQALAASVENGVINNLGLGLASAIRETDIIGWYRSNSIIGVIFTTLNGASHQWVKSVISARIQQILAQVLSSEQVKRLDMSFHFFPEQAKSGETHREANAVLYPTNETPAASDKLFSALKRTMDIGGSLTALVLLSPVFLVVSAGIKATSAGPVFFRQQRLGKCGVEFTFLKFRSMVAANDPEIHKHYTQNLIRGGNPDQTTRVYKIKDDPRITPFGHFLRVTSLDELPQFINVLAGDMSLVGPRPPIPYEFDCYQLWHRRRVLEAKPGITGVWQVNGRSRTTFDEMVRMDLQYIRNRSLWLDFKILLKTPLAVFSRDGAF